MLHTNSHNSNEINNIDSIENIETNKNENNDNNENNEKNIKSSRRFPLFAKIFFAIGGACVPLYAAFLFSERFSDLFNRYVSSALRAVLGKLTSPIPFSLAEFVIILCPVILVALVSFGIKRFADTWRDTLIFTGSILSCVALVFSLFTIGFAPAYRGSTLDKKLGLDKAEVSAEELYDTAERLSELMWGVVGEVGFEEGGFSVMPYDLGGMNDELIIAYDSICELYPFVQRLDTRLKPVMLSDAMSYTHITGVYTFFTGEANINIAFPDYTIPYTAAHELAHQRGIAREDEANFMAFLVCAASDDPYIRYSAFLNLYEYVTSALYSADPELYYKSYAGLPEAVKDEMAAYSDFYDKYRDSVVSEVSGAVNDTFLQINGTEGTKSYGMVVDLAVAFFKTLDSAAEDQR